MIKSIRSLSRLTKTILGSTALGGLVAIVALGWEVYSSHSDQLAMEKQLASQATQIAKQDVQIALNAELNHLVSTEVAIAEQRASIEEQLRTPQPTNNASFAPTATALAVKSSQLEATKRAVEDKQKQIEATQTVVAQAPQTPIVMVRADDVIPKIRGEDWEIQGLLSWWREEDAGNKDGEMNPASVLPDENCYGMAWNTNEYGYHWLVVFQKPSAFTFADGGWYVKVCIPSYIRISADDIGRIQADWLGKRYGIDNQPWEVRIE